MSLKIHLTNVKAQFKLPSCMSHLFRACCDMGNQAYILENCLTFSNFVAKFVADGMEKLCAVHLTISQNGHGYGLNAGLNIITCDISGWLW